MFDIQLVLWKTEGNGKLSQNELFYFELYNKNERTYPRAIHIASFPAWSVLAEPSWASFLSHSGGGERAYQCLGHI